MLFGHQDNSRLANAGVVNTNADTTSAASNPLAIDPVTGVSLPTVPEGLENENLDVPASVLDQQQVDDAPTANAPFVTSDDTNSVPTIPESDIVPNQSAPSFDTSLLALKQQALGQLEPLVNHLDQTPEEKFRTTMMLIQSADNQSLIKTAYDAAQAISDDKARAQALLDVVNEINYFTQKAKNNL